MPRVFISYRRDDSAGYAGRLYDGLCERFGSDSVFMDVGSIDPGEDFVAAINEAVGDSDVLIALIGPRWLSITDNEGRRRLDNPNDFVRLEIMSALEQDIRVIPLLVRDAEMPAADELPAELEELSYRNALELSDERWDYDEERLATAITSGKKERPDDTEGGRGCVKYVFAALIVVAIAAVLLRLLGWPDGSSTAGQPVATPARAEIATVPLDSADVEGDSSEPAESLTGCVITIENPLVTLMRDPDPFSQEVGDVEPGEYRPSAYQVVDTGTGTQGWFRVDAGGRSGWIKDDSWTIEAKSRECPP